MFIFFLKNQLPTYISQVKSYLQVPPEVVCKAGVDIQDLQQVIPQDAVQVTVGDGVHIRIGLPWLIIQVDSLTKCVIPFCKSTNIFYSSR